MGLREDDYYSPNLELILLDDCFPNLISGKAGTAPWGIIEFGISNGVSHPWFGHSSRSPCGYANRDEVILMYNISKAFSHGDGLEIGCFFAWTTAHFGKNFNRLDVVDPILSTEHLQEIKASLELAGVLNNCVLHGGVSPGVPISIGREDNYKPKWSFALLDGDHGRPGPVVDAAAVEPFMLEDAVIVLHDAYFPPVSEGLDFLKWKGWKTRVCQTSNGVGIAWRGSIEPPQHIPDASIPWVMPSHLTHHTD